MNDSPVERVRRAQDLRTSRAVYLFFWAAVIAVIAVGVFTS